MLPWYGITMFLSAFLLFLIQPMVGKMVLPLLGGTPAVWITCMVFFQAVLLVGYAYAHISIRWLGVKVQSMVHVALLILPWWTLPVLIRSDPAADVVMHPSRWLLMQLALCVGLPFFAISSTAPLLQRWFSSTSHPQANDPYFLYSTSNAGSLLALLSYPVLFEPFLRLTEQSEVWRWGYAALAMMIAACALLLRRTFVPPVAAPPVNAAVPHVVPTWPKRAFWLFASFVPSSLMLGVTLHITTNLAAIPLFWVLPLALYLLTFVIAFARRPWVSGGLLARAMPLIILPFGAFFFMTIRGAEWMLIPVHLLMFFVAALFCHTRLAAARPESSHLTEYFLWMSLGGVLGGLFNSLVAPALFVQVIEYPLTMVMACMLLPGLSLFRTTRSRWIRDILWVLFFGLAALLLFQVPGWLHLEQGMLSLAIFYAPMILLVYGFKERPFCFATGYAVVLLMVNAYTASVRGQPLAMARNFFGVKQAVVSPDGKNLRLFHGTTLHGSQRIHPQRLTTPLTYFHPTGPIGEAMARLNPEGLRQPIGVIGLGAGSLAYYAQEEQPIDFFEIDPDVKKFAEQEDFFTFLRDCRGPVRVLLGDGRLTLQQIPDHHYGIFVIDAFSSDAIPVHLITREAMELYLSKLQPGGVLIFHISNRFLGLEPLLGNLARQLNLSTLSKDQLSIPPEESMEEKMPSHCVVLSPDEQAIAPLASMPGWRRTVTNPDLALWTDQYSNLLSVFLW